MNQRIELAAYIGVVVILALLVVAEGRKNAELTTDLPLTPQELYQKLAKSQVQMQIVDVREEADEYEDFHLPGAIPFPGCDPSKTAPETLERILTSVPTVVVSADGDTATFKKCRTHFTTARNLTGGFTAWDDEGLPEDSGEYVPPKASAGGGCL